MFGEMVPSSSPRMTSMRASKETARLAFRASNAAPSAREELRTNWRRLMVIGIPQVNVFRRRECSRGDGANSTPIALGKRAFPLIGHRAVYGAPGHGRQTSELTIWVDVGTAFAKRP